MTQLEMTDIPAPPRPMVDEKIRRTAAEVVAKQLIDDGEFEENELDEIADQIAEAGARYSEGYELAKRLDSHFGWACINAGIVETLDNFSYQVSQALSEAEKVWADKFDIKPPFEIGTRVTVPHGHTGVITEIDSFRAAKYLIKIDGEPKAEPPSNQRRVVNFEDCQAIKAEVVD